MTPCTWPRSTSSQRFISLVTQTTRQSEQRAKSQGLLPFEPQSSDQVLRAKPRFVMHASRNQARGAPLRPIDHITLNRFYYCTSSSLSDSDPGSRFTLPFPWRSRPLPSRASRPIPRHSSLRSRHQRLQPLARERTGRAHQPGLRLLCWARRSMEGIQRDYHGFEGASIEERC